MKNNPKVLFIARRFPPSVGGMERFAFDLSQSLTKKSTRFDLITWGGSNKWLPVVIPWLFLRGLYKLVTVRDYGILHIQDAVLSPLGWLLHKISGKPYIVVAHGLDITWQNTFYQKTIPWFLKQADAIVSISAGTAEEVLKRGVQQDRSYVAPLGITDDTKNITADKKEIADILNNKVIADSMLLLTVGRLVKRKGVEWFITEVLPSIIETHKNVIYLVAGEGVERSAIERAVAEQGLQSRVFLLGEIEEETKLKLYKSCDIFVMPNIKVAGDIEGFGRVAHEAAVAGMPVVASDMEGIADALQDNENGILLETRDTEGYMREITKLIKSTSLRQEFGKKAQQYTLEKFGWDGVAEQYLKIYRRILS